MRVLDIRIPCRRFDVEIKLVPRDGLSLLEKHTVLAIRAGVRSVEELASHLGLPARMVLDVCVDLLANGALALSPDDARISLSETLDVRMGNGEEPASGWAAELESGGGETIGLSLVQDLVSGQVFTNPPFPRELPQGLPVAPRSPAVGPIDSISPLELLLAASRRLRTRGSKLDGNDDEIYEAARLRERRVAEVRIKRAVGDIERTGVAQRETYVPMRLVATLAGENDVPDFRVVGPPEVASEVRDRIAAGLVDAWLSGRGRGAGQFFERLAWSSRASGDAPEEASWLTLDGVLARLSEVSDIVVENCNLHEAPRMCATYDRACEALEKARHAVAECSLVEGAAAHHELALSALGSAKTQVVLACPWIRQLDESDALRTAIEQAVASRGIPVFLLWGIAPNDRLEDQLSAQTCRWLRNLSGQQLGAGRLFLPARSACIHAKVVTCDMDWMVVTSHNFLNSGPQRTTDEIGVRVVSPGPVPHATTCALSWLRRLAPEFEVRRALLDLPELCGRASPNIPMVVTPAPELPSPDTGPLGIDVWQKAWRKTLDTIREQANPIERTVEIVCDAEHRYLLLSALEAAETRVLVQSPELGAAFLGEPVLARLTKAIARGVKIIVLTAKPAPAASRLTNLGVEVAQRNSHAKILLCDDWAVVSSFNFLSFEGRSRSELGVRLGRTPIVEQLWRLCRM